jgi:hypothetical protein
VKSLLFPLLLLLSFYPYIGELIQASVKANDDLFDTMLFVVDKIEEDWGNE